MEDEECLTLFLDDNKLLLCKICTQALEDCMICEGGHSICKLCSESQEVCPFCRMEIMVKNRDFNELISSLKIHCRNKKRGCGEIIAFRKRKNHESFCEFGVRICPVQPCFFTGEESDLGEHLLVFHQPKFFTIGHLYKLKVYSNKPAVVADFLTQEIFILQQKKPKIWLSIPSSTRQLKYKIFVEGQLQLEGKARYFNFNLQVIPSDSFVIEWKHEQSKEIELLIEEEEEDDDYE